MKATIYVVVKIEIETKLPLKQAITEFQEESFYAFESTDNVNVLNTEFLETTTQRPTS